MLVSSLTHPVTRAGRSAAGAVVRPARAAVRWPVESQQRSRRNAMLAASDLTDRRRQTLLVEEFLAGYTVAWEASHACGGPFGPSATPNGSWGASAGPAAAGPRSSA